MADDDRYVLFVCEGKAEQVILRLLLERGEIDADEHHIVVDPKKGTPFITRKDSRRIQDEFLNVSYGAHPLRIIRLIDSKSDVLRLDAPYRGKAEIIDLHTQPEIEMLVIINEGGYDDYTRKHKSRMMPSDFCIRELGLRRVKSERWLEDYWGKPGILEHAIREYDRLHRFGKGEHGLSYLLDERLT